MDEICYSQVSRDNLNRSLCVEQTELSFSQFVLAEEGVPTSVPLRQLEEKKKV